MIDLISGPDGRMFYVLKARIGTDQWTVVTVAADNGRVLFSTKVTDAEMAKPMDPDWF